MDPAEGPATARVTPEHRYENTTGPIGRVNPPVRDGSYEGLWRWSTPQPSHIVLRRVTILCLVVVPLCAPGHPLINIPPFTDPLPEPRRSSPLDQIMLPDGKHTTMSDWVALQAASVVLQVRLARPPQYIVNSFCWLEGHCCSARQQSPGSSV
jgi:hypothetical protein